MSNSFPGDSPTPVGRPRVKSNRQARSVFTPVGSSTTKTGRVARLKDELQAQLAFIVQVRASLMREFAMTKGADITRDFTSRLKDLTACYSDLSAGYIRLTQAEKKMGEDLSPAEERDTAVEYILSLEPSERRDVLAYLNEKAK